MYWNLPTADEAGQAGPEVSKALEGQQSLAWPCSPR